MNFLIALVIVLSISNGIILGLYLKNKPKYKRISNEETINIVNVDGEKFTLDVDDETLFKLVEKHCRENYKPKKLEGSNYFEALVPCECHECAQHPTREDCCNSLVEIDGKLLCRRYYNFDNLKKEGKLKNDKLTQEEVKIFTDAFMKWKNTISK